MIKILLFLSFISMIACSHSSYIYYYIELPMIEGMKVSKVSTIKLKELRQNKAIPTEYKLDRTDYTIFFTIGDTSYFPHLNIKVVSKDTYEALKLKPVREPLVAKDGNQCASYYIDKDNYSKFDFGWSTNCLSSKVSKIITFEVIGPAGKVANETIPFDVKSNGKYSVLDAL